jgi:hypothetical protein
MGLVVLIGVEHTIHVIQKPRIVFNCLEMAIHVLLQIIVNIK